MYSTLYTARQQEARYLPRKWYYDDALALPWVRSINIKTSEKLDKAHARGLIYSTNRQTHGGHTSFEYTIVIAAGLSIEWERFVTIKELMHCYFAPIDTNVKYFTSSQIALESLMNSMFGSSTAVSQQHVAEKMALWMAVGVVCTENDRQAMLNGIADQSLNPAKIASEMKIPLKQAKNLVSKVYQGEIEKLI